MNNRAWLLFAAVSLLWGMPYLFIKVAIEDLSPVFVVFGRAAIAAAVLVPIALARGILGALRGHLRFVLALLMGAGSGAALGGLIEWSLIRPLYSRPIYQVLVTLGLVFVGTEAVKGVWGPTGYYMDLPDFFSQRGDACPSPNLLAWLRDNCASIDVLGRPFPSYRI